MRAGRYTCCKYRIRHRLHEIGTEGYPRNLPVWHLFTRSERTRSNRGDIDGDERFKSQRSRNAECKSGLSLRPGGYRFADYARDRFGMFLPFSIRVCLYESAISSAISQTWISTLVWKGMCESDSFQNCLPNLFNIIYFQVCRLLENAVRRIQPVLPFLLTILEFLFRWDVQNLHHGLSLKYLLCCLY